MRRENERGRETQQEALGRLARLGRMARGMRHAQNTPVPRSPSALAASHLLLAQALQLGIYLSLEGLRRRCPRASCVPSLLRRPLLLLHLVIWWLLRLLLLLLFLPLLLRGMPALPRPPLVLPLLEEHLVCEQQCERLSERE
jgi:hypothetical protein